MPISYILDPTQCRILTTVTGSITLGEVRSHFEAVSREQALSYAELIDARAATEPTLFSSDIRQAADLVLALPGRQVLGPRAILVGSEVAFGMARMLAILLSDRLMIKVFIDRDVAEQWLAYSV